MSEEKQEVLINVTKTESNVNVSIANSVLNWIVSMLKGAK